MESLTSRRGFMQLAGLAGLHWLTPLGEILAQDAERRRKPAQSVILLWLAGGPSQLETFDPHPGTASAGGTGGVPTAARGVQLAEGFPRLAEVMDAVALVRSVVSKEGDHERGTYLMKTGYRPDATLDYPSIGAICCHELPEGSTTIPRHISILPSQWPAKGGFLGDEYNAFKVGDPADKLPDLSALVPPERDRRRLADLAVVERAFARGRQGLAPTAMQRGTLGRARAMMTSEQLQAFDVRREPLRLRQAYGDTAFGRGCLAARRLIEAGVRCVEVTLDGWDTHTNNHARHRDLLAILDPAFSSLIRDLRERGLLERTVVLCGGEFGRTPRINAAGGRDHWPVGFSLALAGGGIGGGRVVGATDPEGVQRPTSPATIADVHATVLTALGLDPAKEVISPVKRPIRLSQGQALESLVS